MNLNIAIGVTWVTFIMHNLYSDLQITYRRAPGFVTGTSCGVWCRELPLTFYMVVIFWYCMLNWDGLWVGHNKTLFFHVYIWFTHMYIRVFLGFLEGAYMIPIFIILGLHIFLVIVFVNNIFLTIVEWTFSLCL